MTAVVRCNSGRKPARRSHLPRDPRQHNFDADDAVASAIAMADTKRDKRIWPHVVSGVAGRVAAEFWMSPFNLLKVRLEHDLRLKQLAGRDLPRALLEVVRAEGVRGAWIGLRPRLMWTAPLAAATFTYYSSAKSVVDSSGGEGSESQASSFQYRTVVAGPALVAASVALRTPFDIVEQQLQLQRIRAATAAAAAPELVASAAAAPPPQAARKSVAATLQKVWRAEGWRGVWRGYSAAYCGIASYVVGYFGVYEATRRTLLRTPLGEYTTLTHLLAGGLGGGLTAALATPFDVIKVRMQTKVYATAADPFPSMPTVWRKTVAEAGWSALTRSAFTRVVSNAPSGAIMFTVYEGGVKYIEGRLEGRA